MFFNQFLLTKTAERWESAWTRLAVAYSGYPYPLCNVEKSIFVADKIANWIISERVFHCKINYCGLGSTLHSCLRLWRVSRWEKIVSLKVLKQRQESWAALSLIGLSFNVSFLRGLNGHRQTLNHYTIPHFWSVLLKISIMFWAILKKASGSMLARWSINRYWINFILTLGRIRTIREWLSSL